MTHFWPDYTSLIAELRMGSGAGSHEARTTNELFSRAADALEAERKVRVEEYAIAKHLRAEQHAKYDAVISSYEQAAFNVIKERDQAIAAKEQAEAEHKKREEELVEAYEQAENECTALTSALASARAEERERCAKHVEDRFGKDAVWAIAAAIRSLSYPTTEPVKAEEP